MTKAKEPKPPKVPAVSIDTPQKFEAVLATGKLPWHCDICGADVGEDVCPIDGKVKP